MTDAAGRNQTLLVRWRTALRAPFGNLAWAIGLVAWWVSLEPTTRPRSPMAQGVVSGSYLAIGMLAGSLLAWLLSSVGKRTPRASSGKATKRNRRLLLLLTVVLVVIRLPWWVFRQNSQRGQFDMDVLAPSAVVTVVLGTVLVAVVLIVIGRSFALLVRCGTSGLGGRE